MKKTFLTTALIVAFSLPAQGAAFLTNYSDWRQQSPEVKLAYVMGVFDTRFGTFTKGDAYGEADTLAVDKCGEKLNLDSSMLVQLVETNYVQNPSSWGTPPIAVLHLAVLTMCKTHVNDFRSAKGLIPLK